jgi:TonB family protein
MGFHKGCIGTVVIALALTACATQAQQEMGQIAQQMKDLTAQNQACLAPIEANPRYARVYEKLGVATSRDPGRMPSAAQLGDPEVIPGDDIAVGLEWYAEGQACEAPGVQAFGRIDPEFEIFFADVHAEIADLINDIVSKRLTTYGQVNGRLLNLKQRERAVVTEIATNLKARLQAEHQEELAQQQETAEELVSAFGQIAVALATRGHASVNRLASREAALERAQESYARLHPRYVVVHRVRAIHCDSIGRSLQCNLQPVSAVIAGDPAPISPPPSASAPVVSPDYARTLSAWVEAHKVYPETARLQSEQGRVVVRVRVDRSGHVLSYALIGTSGYADLDASVVDMMRNAVLPPFPPSMTVSAIDVTVPVRFGLIKSPQ